MAVSEQDALTIGTLDGLEVRLKQLEALVSGHAAGDTEDALVSAPSNKDETVMARMSRLENVLEKLSQSSRPIADLLRLYKQHPDLFPPSTTLPPSSSFNTREKLATVNACAPSFSAAASQLTSVQDSPIPSAEDSAALVALQPRLAAAERRQANQAKELASLRMRTAQILQRWYDVSVMGGDECWAEWDERLMEAERHVRRAEAKWQSENGPV